MFGLCTLKAYRKGCYKPGEDTIYDSNGKKWEITSISPEPQFNLLQRIASVLFWNPLIRFNLTCSEIGRYDIDELKDFIRKQVDSDPGDLLLQFMEKEEIEESLKSASTHSELFRFLKKLLT